MRCDRDPFCCFGDVVAVNLNNMTGIDLEELERAAGLDPDSPAYKLATALAEADDELLEALVQMRKDKGLTQAEVAKRMKRDRAAVSNFERLSADPHLSTIRRYAAAIGASVTHDVRDAETVDWSAALNSLDARKIELHNIIRRIIDDSVPQALKSAWFSDEGTTGSNVIPLAPRRARKQTESRAGHAGVASGYA